MYVIRSSDYLVEWLDIKIDKLVVFINLQLSDSINNIIFTFTYFKNIAINTVLLLIWNLEILSLLSSIISTIINKN